MSFFIFLTISTILETIFFHIAFSTLESFISTKQKIALLSDSFILINANNCCAFILICKHTEKSRNTIKTSVYNDIRIM